MSEYLIFFNDEWVTETTDAGWQQRARDARAVVEEMRVAGVLLSAVASTTMGASSTSSRGRAGRSSPTVRSPRRRRYSEASPRSMFPARARRATGPSGSPSPAIWPQEVRIFRTPAQIPTPDADRAAAARRSTDAD